MASGEAAPVEKPSAEGQEHVSSLFSPDGKPYVSMLLYSEPSSGKSTFASTAPKPMKVYCFDQKQKEMPYIKRGKIIEEGVTEFKTPYVKIGTKKTGKHIITIEYYRNENPEKPTAYPRFLRSMSKLHEDLDYYNTFVLDSVTYLEKAARWHDQFVTNRDAKDKRQHYIVSADAVEMQVMGRFASLPKNSIVICHVLEKKDKDGEDISKQRFGSKRLFVPAAPGAKARQLPSAFSEIYRLFIDNKNEHMLQTRTDGMWLAATQIEAPNPCEPNWVHIWENWNNVTD